MRIMLDWSTRSILSCLAACVGAGAGCAPQVVLAAPLDGSPDSGLGDAAATPSDAVTTADTSPPMTDAFDPTGAPCGSNGDCGDPSFACAYAIADSCAAKGVCQRLHVSNGCASGVHCACDGTLTHGCDLPTGYAHNPVKQGDFCGDAGTADAPDPTGTVCNSNSDCGNASFACVYPTASGCTATGVCEPLHTSAGCTEPPSCACDGTITSGCDLPTGFFHKPAKQGGFCGDAGAADAGAADATSEMCSTYCSAMMTACSGTNAQFLDMVSCQNACAIMQSSFNTHFACRAMHATYAMTTPNPECWNAGPFGYGPCGAAYEDFCDLAVAFCSPAGGFDAGTPPYNSVGDCWLRAAGYTVVTRTPNNGPPAQYGLDGGFNATGPAAGNTLDCREYHLMNALRGGAAQQSECNNVGPASPACQ
ncbi:MAG: hypothetical protein M3O36_14570 [Myxococcota bacterium]|nr:hypothetical protein [Myxococcota bacterium]